MMDYCLSQKFKLLGNSEFNHLTIIILTSWNFLLLFLETLV